MNWFIRNGTLFVLGINNKLIIQMPYKDAARILNNLKKEII